MAKSKKPVSKNDPALAAAPPSAVEALAESHSTPSREPDAPVAAAITVAQAIALVDEVVGEPPTDPTPPAAAPANPAPAAPVGPPTVDTVMPALVEAKGAVIMHPEVHLSGAQAELQNRIYLTLDKQGLTLRSQGDVYGWLLGQILDRLK